MADVADLEAAQKAFEALGINEGDTVILYDDYSHMFAGRIWWAMQHWGFAEVRVLNGGWSHWTAQGRVQEKCRPKVTPGNFQPVERPELRVSLDTFLAAHEASCVIDGRGAEGFAGKPDDPRTGHIPGSLNIPFSKLLDPETGCFLPPHEISAVLDADAPDWRNMPIIASCGSGYAATVVLLALRELDHTAPLFDGSFARWRQDPDRPIAQSY